MISQNAYNLLAQRMKDSMLLSESIGFLEWDIRTYMPKKAIEQRSQMISLLTKINHELFTSEKTGDLLKEASKIPNLNKYQARNLYLWQKFYDRETKLSTELVEKIAKHRNKTEHLWETAKSKSDFKMVENDLKIMFELNREKALAISPEKKEYDTLLDIYEPNITQDLVSEYFEELKKGVIKVQNLFLNKGIKVNPSILKQKISKDKQQEISKFIMQFLNLDPNRSRIDESEHPFSTGYGDDIRITTHYLDNDPMGSFYSVFHEAGHARYELDLPEEFRYTAIGNAVGLGVHESQSRFFENIIGKSKPFLSYIFPKLQNWVLEYKKISFSDFYWAINAITPSKIRIYADEVTYNLHIILRFEIERDYYAGKLDIKDLPAIWNEKMEKYLDQKIDNAKEGVLQDIHWYGGDMGYFPDYALGNIYDGVFLEKINKDLPNWQEELSHGNANPVLDWLDNNVHKKGFMYDPVDLIENITGKKPNASNFIKYLENKYLI